VKPLLRENHAMKSAPKAPETPESSYQAIYRVIREIPEGKVATYGQIAALAALPGHAREVGYALNVLPEGPLAEDVPWQRVINAKGEISLRSPNQGPGREGYQRHLLEEEGVEFDLSGRVDLRRFAWDPSRKETQRLQKPQPSQKPQRSTKRRSAQPAGGVPRRSATDERRKG
jgi:methylated-DNA-protein-cysteine methyltransferase-like protein